MRRFRQRFRRSRSSPWWNEVKAWVESFVHNIVFVILGFELVRLFTGMRERPITSYKSVSYDSKLNKPYTQFS